MNQIKATVLYASLLAVSLVIVDCSPVNITIFVDGDKATPALSHEYYTVSVFNNKTEHPVKIHAEFLKPDSDSTGRLTNKLVKRLLKNETATIRAPKSGSLAVQYTVVVDAGKESDLKPLFHPDDNVATACIELTRDDLNAAHENVECNTLNESSYVITYL